MGTAEILLGAADLKEVTQMVEIASTVSVPLVLHGGSGLSDDDFREAVDRGIAKINIFTDISKAQVKGMPLTPSSRSMSSRASKTQR